VSEESTELVRKALDEFTTTHRAVERLTAPDFVWDLGSFEGWPDKQEYTGPDAFNEFIAAWTAPYEDWDFDVQDLRDLDHDRVLAIVSQRGRPCGAGSWVELHYGMIITVVGGLLSRAQVFGTREATLKAAGLGQSP
jgi:ketosteroid isomerase-like protein